MNKYILDNQKIIDMYLSGGYLKSIGRELLLDPSVVKRILKENNIPIRVEDYRKYKIREDFFDVVDTEEKAYMLGFLFADGNVSNKNNRYNICLTLSEYDKDILHVFANYIFIENADNQVKTFKSKQPPCNLYSNININSKHMVSKLIELNCVPKKSLILQFPKQINNEIISKHWIRGYFDGDGCITKNNYLFSITSTLEVCSKIKSIMDAQLNTNLHIYKYKNIYRLSAHGRNKIIEIFKWLYLDATVFLKRKYDIFHKIAKEETPYFSEEEIFSFVQHRKNGMSYNKIAKLYNYSDTGIRKAIIRFNK